MLASHLFRVPRSCHLLTSEGCPGQSPASDKDKSEGGQRHIAERLRVTVEVC